MPLSDIKSRNIKPREKPYKASDFDGLFLLVKVRGSKAWHFIWNQRNGILQQKQGL